MSIEENNPDNYCDGDCVNCDDCEECECHY